MNRLDRVPTIDILFDSVHGGMLRQIAEEIAYGIEEEGMIFRVLPQEFLLIQMEDLLRHTYLQCQASVLGVAVGVNDNAIIIHDRKMKEHNPVLLYPNDFDLKRFRRIGQNAARLVKCKPFIIES